MSAGGDAFVQDWSKGFGYFHLPVVLVFKVFDKARGEEAQGILVVPDWPGSRWPGGQVGPGGGP
jgi:hypothetical protein